MIFELLLDIPAILIRAILMIFPSAPDTVGNLVWLRIAAQEAYFAQWNALVPLYAFWEMLSASIKLLGSIMTIRGLLWVWGMLPVLGKKAHVGGLDYNPSMNVYSPRR